MCPDRPFSQPNFAHSFKQEMLQNRSDQPQTLRAAYKRILQRISFMLKSPQSARRNFPKISQLGN